ncbi:ribbon-helix-helix domain-containing protein [Kitasatospora sp. NPDC051853]|uniref:ribbon-helix-helix domain-containing protein n=1 Tax=Kitasatospora sp. NPDC051853 TaxID=3364058 RepID=UPI00379412F8
MPQPPATRRITLHLPVDLADWLQGFAEISHRSVDEVIRASIEAEKARVEANWDPPRSGDQG